MTFFELADQFLHALAGCFFVVAIVAAFGLTIAMDTTALTGRGRRAKVGATADILGLNGQGIAGHYAIRWWRRRKRRLRRV